MASKSGINLLSNDLQFDSLAIQNFNFGMWLHQGSSQTLKEMPVSNTISFRGE